MFGGGYISNHPRDAEVLTHQVQAGDILVFATDGVWDNLSSLDVLRVVQRHMVTFQIWKRDDAKGSVDSHALQKCTREGGVPKQYENSLQAMIAMAVAGEAKATSVDKSRDGPFAMASQRHFPGNGWYGGKPDDICVVVAIVVKGDGG